jgi:hypothetical protein
MSRARLVLVITAAAVPLAACSSSGGGTTPPPSAPAATTAPAAAATTPAAVATTSAAATSALSGAWSGQYSGAYSGTFKLHWNQSGSTLSGTINVPALGGSQPIHGTVNGSTIKFGTVGSEAITYNGSVSGSSMSGTWKISAPTGSAGGSWSAAKS